MHVANKIAYRKDYTSCLYWLAAVTDKRRASTSSPKAAAKIRFSIVHKGVLLTLSLHHPRALLRRGIIGFNQ